MLGDDQAGRFGNRRERASQLGDQGSLPGPGSTCDHDLCHPSESPDYPVAHHQDTLIGEQPYLLARVWSPDPASGTDDTPPGQPLGVAENGPHRSGGSRIAGLSRHLPVGDDVARLE